MNGIKRPTEADKGRIALKILMLRMQENEEIPTRQSVERELPNIAKKISEPADLLRGFYIEMLPDLLRMQLGCQSIELMFDDKAGGVVKVKSAE